MNPYFENWYKNISVFGQISAMGFDTDIARLALRKHNGSIEEAVADLINNQGIVTVDQGNAVLKKKKRKRMGVVETIHITALPFSRSTPP